MFDYVRRRFIQALLLPIVVSTAAVADQPRVNGRLESIGDVKVLRVWGTPHEMGFAHGYLIGADFVRGLELGGFVPMEGDPKEIDRARMQLRQVVQLPPRIAEELKGMYDGIVAQAGGKPPVLRTLDRALAYDDLVLHNAGDMLRAFGCSGFTVWGERAGEEGLITARNFDFAAMHDIAVESGVLLVRHPAGRTPVAMLTGPCFIGAYTGVSADGVCTFMHDGTGTGQRKPSGPATPLSVSLTGMLETMDVSDPFGHAERELKAVGMSPFSYMVRVIAPQPMERGQAPVRVFRIDAGGVSTNPVGNGVCITTNHYLEPDGTAVEGANDWSLLRYRRLANAVEDKDVTPAAAFAALRSVTLDSDRAGTIHSVVVYPKSRKLDVAVGKWKDKLVPATRFKPTTITFDALFRDPTK